MPIKDQSKAIKTKFTTKKRIDQANGEKVKILNKVQKCHEYDEIK